MRMRRKGKKVMEYCLVAGERTKGGELVAGKNDSKKEIAEGYLFSKWIWNLERSMEDLGVSIVASSSLILPLVSHSCLCTEYEPLVPRQDHQRHLPM